MGVIEDILKNREEMIEKFLDVLSGKEATAKVNLDGVQFNIGKSRVRMEGEVRFTLIPGKKK